MWCLLIVFPVKAENRLLDGFLNQGRPCFLVADGDTVTIRSVDGEIISSVGDVLLLDAEDDGYIMCLSADRLVWFDKRFRRHERPIKSLNRMLRLIETPRKFHMIENGLFIIPSQSPYLLNPENDKSFSVPGINRLENRTVAFTAEDIMSAGHWIVVRDGRSLVVVDRAQMKEISRIEVGKRKMIGVTYRDNRLTFNLEKGVTYTLNPVSGDLTEKKVETEKDTVHYQVLFKNDGLPHDVSVTLQDTGMFSMLDAWKEGRMTAEINVHIEENKSVTQKVNFSVRDIGRFKFVAFNVSGALVLRFLEKDVIISRIDGAIRFTSVLAGVNYAVAGGRIYVMKQKTIALYQDS